MDVETAYNVRDKSRMKQVLRAAAATNRTVAGSRNGATKAATRGARGARIDTAQKLPSSR
jgi:hypothetical protein